MQHGNVSNIASFSKKNDDLRYVSLTWNLKAAQAVCYKQEQTICMWKTEPAACESASSVWTAYKVTSAAGSVLFFFPGKTASEIFWFSGRLLELFTH